MSWFRDRFFGPPSEPTRTEIPFSTVTRWSLYDLALENPNRIAVDMGLNPVSDEGHQKEREDSEIRLSNLRPLLPFIDIAAEINGRIFSSVQLSEIEKLDIEVDIEDEQIETMIAFFKSISTSALIVAFSAALQLDLIHSHVATEEYDGQ